MSFGGGAPSPPALRPAAPVRAMPEVAKAKMDLRERLKRARSRALSRVTEFGLLEIEAPVRRPMLSDIMG